MAAYRSTYHHGNLRAALTDAALDLARRSGPESVTMRGVARRVGVTPPAAYRHFTEAKELQDETKGRALTLLSERIDAAVRAVAAAASANGADNPAAAAAARVRAVAEGYVGFARSAPGLFAMACHDTVEAIRALTVRWLEPSLDVLSARRPGVCFAVWSAVHALAVMTVEEQARRAAAGEAPGDVAGDAARDAVAADEVLDTVLGWIVR